MAFLECFQTVFLSYYHKQNRELFCLQDKDVAQSILENFGFHNKYDDEYEKVFITFWTLQTKFCNSVHVEWLLSPCSKKVAAVCHK